MKKRKNLEINPLSPENSGMSCDSLLRKQLKMTHDLSLEDKQKQHSEKRLKKLFIL